jgi:hypothetical protein
LHLQNISDDAFDRRVAAINERANGFDYNAAFGDLRRQSRFMRPW